MTRTIVLVDGEHYPPVTQDAIEHLARAHDVVAAVFAGGSEKLAGPPVFGDLPVVTGASARAALEQAIDGFSPGLVFDCSDVPVVDTATRMLLASVALARGVAYAGAGFRFDPPPRPRLTTRPTIAVIGTGKRTGKTALSAALARHAAARGLRPVIVAMGRGGPAEPVVTRARPDAASLIALADRGEHAATDAYEDALVAGVTTVGARRAGAGLSGATVHDTVAAAVAVADAESPGLILLEGSGAAIPPAHADATLLVVGGRTPPAEMRAGLAPYRLLISDLAVVTMAEEPVLSTETVSALTSLLDTLERDVPIVRTVFRPAPLGPVAGKRVFFATTAPEAAVPALIEHLESAHGAVVAGATHRLSDRDGLAHDLSRAEGTYEVLLTELKAAAVDVAARTALAAGAAVEFADNLPVAVEGDLEGAFDRLLKEAGA